MKPLLRLTRHLTIAGPVNWIELAAMRLTATRRVHNVEPLIPRLDDIKPPTSAELYRELSGIIEEETKKARCGEMMDVERLREAFSALEQLKNRNGGMPPKGMK